MLTELLASYAGIYDKKVKLKSASSRNFASWRILALGSVNSRLTALPVNRQGTPV